MYAYQNRLDTPPPLSHFRRPWSPLEEFPRSQIRQQVRVREASEVSFEALDLADYAATLQRTNNSMMREPGPYPMYIDADGYPEYPGTPPRSLSLASKGTITSIPSLTSHPTTHASQSRSSTPRTPARRPFSMPPTISQTPVDLSYVYSSRLPRIFDPQQYTSRHNDFAQFSPDFPPDTYELEKRTTDSHNSQRYLAEYPSYSARPYSSSNDSHRALLPWADDEEAKTHVSSEMKEERMRILEREFATKPSNGVVQYDEGRKLIGSIGAKGQLITHGPKKRAIIRWVQFLFASGSMIASVYSALILKPPGSPPPRGRVPAYLLYILSTLTILYILYMFLLRAFCCTGNRKNGASFEGPAGLMVLPVQGLPGSKKKKEKGGKKGRKGRDNDSEGVQVNLIVDPTVFGTQRRGNQEDESDEDAEAIGGRRRGLFEGLAMEERWKTARKRLKTRFFFDMLLFFLWAAEFIVILLGKRCPVGQFDGWCDGYNVATALACLLAFAYGFSVYFGIMDLHSSRVSPRSRT